MYKQLSTRSLRIALIMLIAFGFSADAFVRPTTTDAAFSFTPFNFVDETVIGASANLPLATAIAWGGTQRMFVALKTGEVRVALKTGNEYVLQATPFIDLRDEVNTYNDRGLTGLAVHPDFPNQPYVYLLYVYDPTNMPQGQRDGSGARVIRLLRVKADASKNYTQALPRPNGWTGTNPNDDQYILLGKNSTLANIGDVNNRNNYAAWSCNSPATASGTPVQDCIAADHDSHASGTVAFAPDGMLLISNGDGANYMGTQWGPQGLQNYPDPRAFRSQNQNALESKMLRIDPITGAGLPDNPFFQAGTPNSNMSKIYSLGLRNPFRFAIHPNGEPFIGDVGWNAWEEVNTGKAANFGWPCFEGGVASGLQGSNTENREQGAYRTPAELQTFYNTWCSDSRKATMRPPLFAYSRDINGNNPSGASVNAGAFYTGVAYPSQYQGALFIGDYSKRTIRYLTFDNSGVPTVHDFAQEASGGIGPVQITQGPDTNLYVVMHRSNGSEVRRIRYTGAGNTPPTPIARATQSGGSVPVTINFIGDQSFDPDANDTLTFTWNFGDGATSNDVNPSHQYTQSGTFNARLTVSDGTVSRTSDNIPITVSSTYPNIQIVEPLEVERYNIGDTIPYRATFTAGGSAITPQSIKWDMKLHHEAHIHNYNSISTSASGSLVTEEHGDETWIELCVTATYFGASNTQCVNQYPRKTTHTIDSQPRGMKFIYLDEGTEHQTPDLLNPIVNSIQTVTLDSIQNGMSFLRWSDGITTTSRTFTVGTTPITYTALFTNQVPVANLSGTPNASNPYGYSFSSAGSADPERTVLKYAWDFGDGLQSGDANPSHIYAAPGTYTVRLTVIDGLGASATSTMQVTVPPPPQPSPGPTDTKPLIYLPLVAR